MFGFIKKILGSKSDKDLKDLYPLVDDINIEFDKLKNISDDELRNKTFEFKEIIQNNLNDSNQVIDSLREKYKKSDGSLSEKENILNEIDSLKESQKEIIEKTLNELLPEAFAVVKETARRFTENESLEVTASDFDRELASKKDNIEIDGSKAVWYNEWSAAGVDIKWNMIHYDVQLIGGIVLHQGKISEMATGEGKTLVATLPAYLNALSERGVHIVTVNYYLAKRDAEWNAPIFEFHGLRVDCIDKHESNSKDRISAYNADITYGTNNEFGFDYLRDNMVREKGELVQENIILPW